MRESGETISHKTGAGKMSEREKVQTPSVPITDPAKVVPLSEKKMRDIVGAKNCVHRAYYTVPVKKLKKFGFDPAKYPEGEPRPRMFFEIDFSEATIAEVGHAVAAQMKITLSPSSGERGVKFIEGAVVKRTFHQVWSRGTGLRKTDPVVKKAETEIEALMPTLSFAMESGNDGLLEVLRTQVQGIVGRLSLAQQATMDFEKVRELLTDADDDVEVSEG